LKGLDARANEPHMTKIKFCGMTRPADATVARELGASHVGVIFAESRRRVSAEQAREVLDGAEGLRRVGVFGPARGAIPAMIRTSRIADLDVIQMHGSFSPEDITHLRSDFDGEVWAVVPVDSVTGALPDEWEEIADIADAFLVDSRVGTTTGGTGKPFPWEAAAPSIHRAAAMLPVVLAGGLTPSNVEQAIRILRPSIVDVSSGVESSPGIKDPVLMQAFAEAVVAASIV
jgi:phosphoribosylanthranilate isomerase